MTQSDSRIISLFERMKAIAGPGVTDDQVMREAAAIVIAAPFASIMDHPRAKDATERKARQELMKLETVAKDFAAHLRGLSATSIESLRNLGNELKPGGLVPFRHPIEVLADVEKMAFVASRAAGSATLPGVAQKQTTRPAKLGALKIAELTADAYLRITDKHPTIASKDGRAYGKFHDLLAHVFDATGFKGASAESIGKRAIKAMEKSPSKHRR